MNIIAHDERSIDSASIFHLKKQSPAFYARSFGEYYILDTQQPFMKEIRDNSIAGRPASEISLFRCRSGQIKLMKMVVDFYREASF